MHLQAGCFFDQYLTITGVAGVAPLCCASPPSGYWEKING